MSEFNIDDIGDKMLKERLKKKASELGISEGELIDKYILEGLNSEIESVDNQMSNEDLKRIFQEESENDKEIYNGKNGNFDELLELINLRNKGDAVKWFF